MEVNARSSVVSGMAVEWPMLEALAGGTAAMRKAGASYLPKWPNEEDDAWKARLATATLFPAYRRTVAVMSGKPFSKAVTLGEDVPDQIKEWAEDIDREGVNLHTFCAEMFAEAFYGLAGILVEAPKLPDTGGRIVTRAEQAAAGVRPYFVRVMHDQILGWRLAEGDGPRRLAQLRIKEHATVPDGDFGEKVVERVRVLEPGSFRVFEKTEGDGGKVTWPLVDSGQTGLTVIPFAPIYGRRVSFMLGAPPLLDLAYLNVKHWQSQSDQDTILHVARVPILFLSGADDNTKLTVGGSAAVAAPAGATLEFVEHTGAAIGAGQKSLDALEEQMIQAGAELLVKKPGDRSATEAANDAEGNKSDLQRMVEGFEDTIDLALQFMADYASLPSGGHVSLFKDFGAATLQSASAQLILGMNQSGLISDETTIAEMKRRGELAAEVDYETERDRIAEQGPALGMMGEDDPANDDSQDDNSGDTVESGAA
jgi:hypothetical protein